MSVECPAHDGLHIFEDAFVVQIVDPETGDPLPDGEQGSLCITELYKTGSPQFRYNIMDLSTLYPRGALRRAGAGCRKMAPFAGRGDNMVKLRGVNVWPEAVGEIAVAVAGRRRRTGSSRAVRDENRDELIVTVDERRPTSEFDALAAARSRSGSRERLGVKIQAEVVAPGALDAWTEVGNVARS